MKKTHVVVLVLTAIAVAVIISMFGNFSTYETFASASNNPGKQYRIIGYLDKDQPLVYDPKVDPNHFEFHAEDKAGGASKVIFSGAKPTDFERSEEIVMSGYMEGDVFKCKEIQMKCPSKYENDQIAVGI